MNYLFAAYSAIWILLFAYMFSISRRQHRVQGDLDRLRERLEQNKR
ncbi:MAG: CcmD family protein [Terriglobia bacterium]